MIRQTASLEVLQHEIRRRICARCYRRPTHSDMLGPEAVRFCQETCPVFVHLPMLRNFAIQLDPMLVSSPEALRNRINDICWDQGAAESPLSRYRDQIIAAVVACVGEQ